MSDPVFQAFLAEQFRQGQKLVEQSDLVRLKPMDTSEGLPTFYIAQFLCKGLVCSPEGTLAEASEFLVGISFPPDYLRRADPMRVLTWLDPVHIWHPNIRPPAICAGRIAPGLGLVDLVYQCFEMITYTNFAAHDALNAAAAQWARRHQLLFPIDRRPLKRREVSLRVQESRIP